MYWLFKFANGTYYNLSLDRKNGATSPSEAYPFVAFREANRFNYEFGAEGDSVEEIDEKQFPNPRLSYNRKMMGM